MMIYGKNLACHQFKRSWFNTVCDGFVISNEGLLRHRYVVVFKVVPKTQEAAEVDQD
jgi:hypothetical protein